MDTVTVHKNVSLSLAWFIALATLAVFPFISVQAEEFEAKAATLPAPQMVAPPDVTTMPPPMSQSEGEGREFDPLRLHQFALFIFQKFQKRPFEISQA